MVDVAADYDSVSAFHVYPDDLVTHGNNIKAHNQDIVDSLTRIMNCLKDLQLGWAGKTSEEAKAFGDKWDRVAGELFGSEDHPENGVLNAIAVGVMTVAGTFSNSEHSLADMFNNFANALTQGGGGSTPTNITDVTTTAVTETWG